MKRLIVLTVLIALCVAPIALAGNNKASVLTVVGSKHDLRVTGGGVLLETDQAQVCVACHAPHQPTGLTVTPLWNHKLSVVATYGVYSSPTMNVVPTEIGNASGGTGYSNLCMSCHDGTVSVASMYSPSLYGGINGNVPFATTADGTVIVNAYRPTNLAALAGYNANGVMTATNLANLGTNLQGDHPVNFLYATSAAGDAGLAAAGTLPSWALIGGYVQCSSCHDPHDRQYPPFLNASNVASALCTACHKK